MAVGNNSVSIANTLLNAPLPLMIERLGLAIAQAQNALDTNSIAIAQSMADTTVDIGGTEYNLIALGFTPTFYAFTDAMVEAQLEFHLAESEDWGVGGQVGVQAGIVAVSVSAHYARKFEMSATGSSKISARLVSLPAPERLAEILDAAANPAPDPNV